MRVDDASELARLLADTGVLGAEERASIVRGAQSGDAVARQRLLSLALEHERVLAERLAREAGAPVAILTECTLDLSVFAVMPLDMLTDGRVLPIVDDGRNVSVAAADPENADGALEPIAFALGRRTLAVMALPLVVDAVLREAAAAAARGQALWVGPRSTQATARIVVARRSLTVTNAEGVGRRLLPAIDDALIPELDALPVDEPDPSSAPASEVLLVDEPTVLIVEDDDAIRRMVAGVLRAEGLAVVEVGDGAAALEALRRFMPALVVLDAMLPGVHGFEICRAIKDSVTHAQVPVLMISAVYRGIDNARAIQEQHRADAFVEKPFRLGHLRDVAASLLQLSVPPRELPAVSQARAQAAREAYRVHAAAQDWRSAFTDVEQWIAADPFNGRAHLEQGNLFARANDLEHAMSSYEIAALYLPGEPKALGALAMACEQLGFVRKARALWGRLTQLPLDDATRAFVNARLAAR